MKKAKDAGMKMIDVYRVFHENPLKLPETIDLNVWYMRRKFVWLGGGSFQNIEYCSQFGIPGYLYFFKPCQNTFP